MSVTNVGIKLTLDGAQQAETGLRRVREGMAALGNTAESVRGTMQQLAGAFASVVSVRAFVQAADAVAQLQNQLRLATGSTQAATAAYQQLFEIAQRSRVSFTELGGTFATIARATESLGLSQQQLLGVTEAIGNAITVSGSSAAASQAALEQLSQGLASGVLRGEELNSILEQTPRLAQALADGLGVTTGQLRKLGEEGKLTAETVLGALQSQASVLANEVQSSVVTVGQAFTQLQNSATALVGEIDRVSGSSATLAGVAQAASESLDNIARAFRDTQSAGQQVNVFADAIAVVFETVAVLGVNVAYVIKQIGTEIGGLAAQAVAVARLDFSGAREIGRMMREDAAAARREVDALSERILNSRSLAEQARQSMQGGDTREQAEGVRQVGIAAAETRTKVKSLGDEFAAQREAAKGWADAYQDFTRIAAQANAESLGLTKAQARLVEFLSSPVYANASEQMRQLVLEQAYAAITAEQNAAAQEQQAKALEEMNRNTASAEKQLQQLLDEERALVIAAEKNITLAQAIEEVAIARLREQQAALMAEGGREAEVQAIQREIDARERLAEAIGRKEAREAAAKSAREAEREWQRTAESIERSLTDALLRGFESGKDFAANLRDTVVNMFKTMVLRPVIQAIVAPVAGGLTGLFGLPGVAGAAETVGNVSGISGVGNLFIGASTLSSALGLGLGAGFSSIAAAGIGGWLSAGTSLLGTGTLAGIGAGLGLLGGPIGLAASLLGGGALKGLFGRKLKDYGIEGTFSESGFEGNTYQFYKGGLFRSNKTKRGPIDPVLDQTLDQQFMAIKSSVVSMAQALGLGTDAIDAFTTDIKVSFKGLNEQQIQEKLAETLGGVGDKMAASLLEGTDAVIRAGETAGAALQRLGGSLLAVNDAIDLLGGTLLEASLASGDLASKIIEAFGGLDQFGSAVQTYYANFYTEQERLAEAVESMGEAFAGLGLTMPKTKAEFRALVEAQDLTTEAGRKTYAALLQLSGAFAQVADATEQARLAAEQAAQAAAEQARQQREAAISAARDAASAALGALEASVRAEQDRLRDQFERESDVLRDRISAITDVVGVLDSALQSVRGTITANTIASQTAARLTLQSVLTAVRGGADITGFQSVIEQASDTLTRNDPNLYQTREQFVRAQAQSAGLLEELNKAGGKQLTTAELQLQALKDGFAAEMARLDDLVAQAEKQINALLGIDESVLSVEAAVKAVNTAIGQLAESVRGLASAASSQNSAAAPYSGSDTPAERQAKVEYQTGVKVSAADSPLVAAAKVLYQSLNGGASTAQYNAAAQAVGGDIVAAVGWDGTREGAERLRKIYGFAKGGYYPGGLALVGEEGPELINFKNPGMVYTSRQTSEILGNREVVAELKALRSEVIELRAQARRTADAVNGNPEAPMLVETVA